MKLHTWRPLLPWLRRTFPLPFLQWATGVLPWPALRHMRAISDSVYLTSQRVLRRKKELLKQGGESLAQEIGEGKDLMSVLRELSSPVFVAMSYFAYWLVCSAAEHGVGSGYDVGRRHDRPHVVGTFLPRSYHRMLKVSIPQASASGCNRHDLDCDHASYRGTRAKPRGAIEAS